MKKLTTKLILFGIVLFAQRGFAFYDSSVGRWLTRDPLGESGIEVAISAAQGNKPKTVFAEIAEDPDLYRFVRNNPMNVVDTDGRTGWGPPFFPPPPSPDHEGCVMRCIKSNGGGWALAALGASTVGGGTVPKPVGAGALGSGCCTTVPSLIQHFTGLGLRELGRKLNPPATAAQCAAAGYLIGASLSCNAQCGEDVNAY